MSLIWVELQRYFNVSSLAVGLGKICEYVSKLKPSHFISELGKLVSV